VVEKYLNPENQSLVRAMEFNTRQHREAYVKQKAEKNRLRQELGLAKDISNKFDRQDLKNSEQK